MPINAVYTTCLSLKGTGSHCLTNYYFTAEISMKQEFILNSPAVMQVQVCLQRMLWANASSASPMLQGKSHKLATD